ncbi:MAG: hypothetical protein V9G12_04725 [Microthrixaceae bacterium]
MVHLSISTPGAHIQVVRSIGAAAGEEPGLAAVARMVRQRAPNGAAGDTILADATPHEQEPRLEPLVELRPSPG